MIGLLRGWKFPDFTKQKNWEKNKKYNFFEPFDSGTSFFCILLCSVPHLFNVPHQGLQKFCNFTFKLKKLRNYGVNFFLSPQDFQGLPKDWEKIEKDFSETIVLEKKIEIVL